MQKILVNVFLVAAIVVLWLMGLALALSLVFIALAIAALVIALWIWDRIRDFLRNSWLKISTNLKRK